MNTTTSMKDRGFTIIEVVLVLAIAGLIFLMVFLAVPALQRSQRDTQRRDDLGRFMSQLAAYQSNNKGAVPPATAAGVTGFVGSYLNVGGDVFQDPNGSAYTYTTGTGAAPTVASGIAGMRYATSARCGAGGAVSGGGSARQVAVSVALESGGAYCQQN